MYDVLIRNRVRYSYCIWKNREWSWMAAIETTRLLVNSDCAIGIKNMLIIILISRMHYVCMISVNKILTKAIVDTGGARPLIYLHTTRKLSLLVQLATKHHNFGSFQSPNVKPIWYAGRVHGPIRL